MVTTSVTVMGAGVAGLAAALLLARDGHRVTLLERDALSVGAPEDAPTWQRKGTPHFLQPHAFIPRGRAELRDHFADVYEALLAAGGEDVDLRRKLPGPTEPGDENLQYLAVRRPLLEWALRRAVGAEPLVDVHDRVRVSGVLVEHDRVTAVEVDGVRLSTDVLVDALGRRTPTVRWLAQPVASSDCGVVYYCRYYRCRPGFELPDGPWFLSPRGDLGYLGYASFPGDNRTFGAVLAVPPGMPEWRALKDPPSFEAAVARIPALSSWADPAGVDPITDVLPMAGLRNSLRHGDDASAVGLVPVGDAYGHTDPVLAHGLAFALIHAAELERVMREHDEPLDWSQAYASSTGPALRERFDFATALDEQRLRMWLGRPVDLGHADGDYALFSQYAAAAAATIDPDVYRAFIRRIGLLDSTAVLDRDTALQRRIEDLFEHIRAASGPPAGPPRPELVAAVGALADATRR